MRLPPPEVFQHCECILGEGVLWHGVRKSVFWVDISEQLLWERELHSCLNSSRSWSLVNKATAIAVAGGSSNQIWILTEVGLVLFNLDTGEQQRLGKLGLTEGFRTNDGKPGPLGRYWFGSMQNIPDQRVGKLFSVGPEGDYRIEANEIGIPNTFAVQPQNESIYISDSLLQKTYSFDIVSGTAFDFLDFSDQAFTPDGGALDSLGNLWLALWDGYAVKCFSPAGDQLAAIPLPVPRPTSCCFGGQDLKTLFITSAREGLGSEMIDAYPLSGSIFSLKLEVAGAIVPTLFESI